MSADPRDAGCEDAHGCAGAGTRREFLGELVAAACAALAALGAPADAWAVELGVARPTSTRGASRTYPIPARDGAEIDRDARIILVRWKGAVYAFALSCPHQNTALRWDEGNGRFQCPKHKSRYTPDGTFVSGRATRGMDRFALRRDGGSVVVETDRLLKQTDDPAAWAAARITL